MSKKKVKDAIHSLVSGWSSTYQKNAGPLIDRIVALIDQGVPVSKAITQALDETQFFGKNRKALEDSLFTAAAKGYGILPSMVADPGRVIRKIMTMPWSSDGMNLSQRLHGVEVQTRAAINDTIRTAMREGTNVRKLAQELYDGYGYGNIIKETELPKYMKDINRASRRLAEATGDTNAADKIKEFAQKAQRRSVEGLKTGPLKAAYNDLLDAAKTMDATAIEKAAWVAIQEKSRYIAERIARTEIARAWGEGFIADRLDDSDIIGFRWLLSTAHKIFDVCDFHATANLYNLGPGVYPKDRTPELPAHPHCTCRFEEVFEGEAGRPKQNIERGGQRYIEALDESAQKALLGVDGYHRWREGASWQDVMNNWQGHREPKPRLDKSDFRTEDRKHA